MRTAHGLPAQLRAAMLPPGQPDAGWRRLGTRLRVALVRLLGLDLNIQVGVLERARQVRVSSAIGLVTCFFFSLFNLATAGMWVLGLTELAAALFLLAPALVLSHYPKRVDTAEALVWCTVVLVSLALIHFGGVAGTGLYWTFMVPFLAFFLKGQRLGWWYSLAFVAVVLLYLGVLAPLLEGAYVHPEPVLAQFVLALVFYTLVAAAFNQLRSHFEQQLQQRVEEKTRAEEEIRKALAQQEELAAMRSRFMAMTSHEFRTPLALILSSSEMLRCYSTRMPPYEVEKVLLGIEDHVLRMTQMLDRVLQMGKAEDQMLHFAPRRLELHLLLQTLLDEARSQAASTRCMLRGEWDGLPAQAVVDETLLRHIFSNLLSNAVKYSPDGGEILVRGWGSMGTLHFEVSDQGIGIPEQAQPHLFDGFHRASNVGSIAGTGLGLVIVREAVQRHGGQITVQSSTGQGTRFFLSLRCAHEPRAEVY
ncbi:MAG: sensor histidine kinase [Rhodoferax sp.]